MFDIKFYCSGKYSCKGYNVSAIGENKKMIPASFAYAIRPFVYLSSINCALLKKDKEYHIILLGIEQPEGFEKRATDISGSGIKINLSISSSEKNEEAVRNLFYAIYFHYSEISYALYDAYDFCVNDSVGYSFDADKINALIEKYAVKDTETAKHRLKGTSERFVPVESDELRALLAKKLPEKDGVYFAELAITSNSFENYFSKSQFPWYVFDNQYRKNSF